MTETIKIEREVMTGFDKQGNPIKEKRNETHEIHYGKNDNLSKKIADFKQSFNSPVDHKKAKTKRAYING